ncbi:MAG: hypothetical protein KDD61_05515, partial [Bdellovibrionales bacterium]|nr:hypothetical protein [Bdellovibrionales bacterium]
LQPTGPRFLVGDPAKGKRMTEFKSMGISQINILAHNDMIAGAAYFDLIQNILEGYDNFYRLWSRARVALLNSSKATGGLVKCAKYIKDYEDVAQSAYSAYTGGGFCRWHFSPIRKNEWEKRTGCRFPLHLSPKDKYKQCESDFRKTQFSLHWNNDLDFSYKFKTQPWAKYVDPKLAKVSVDVNCLFDGNHYCLIPDDKREAYLRSHILVVTSSQQENSEILKYCVLLENNKGASCVKELEMLQCLKSSVNRNQYSGIRPISIDDLNSLSSYIHNYNNKYSLCNNESTGIFSPGSFITPKMALTLRANPWVPANQGKNNYLATVRPEQVFQVLDFVIRPGGDLERWYKIRLKTHKNKTLTGFVYGGVGSLDSKNIWTRYWKKSSLNEYDISEALLPSKGMLFRIKHSVTAKLQLVNMQNPSIATKPKKDSYVSHGLIFHKKDSVLYSIDVIVEENGQYFRFPIGTFQRDDEGPGYENTFHQSISIPKRSEEAL